MPVCALTADPGPPGVRELLKWASSRLGVAPVFVESGQMRQFSGVPSSHFGGQYEAPLPHHSLSV